MSAPAAPRREAYHHGDVRAAALAAGLARLESGEDIAIRAVAGDIGVTHRAVALQFGDKAGFEAALAAIGFDRLTAQVAGAPSQAAFLRAYLDFGLTQPRLYDLMMRQSYAAFETHGALRAAADRMIASSLQVLAPMEGDVQTRRRAVMRLWMLAHGGLGLHRAGVLMRRSDAAFIDEFLFVAEAGPEPTNSPDQALWRPAQETADD
jgi:hypothetical protein